MNSLVRIRRPFSSFGVSKLHFFCTSLPSFYSPLSNAYAKLFVGLVVTSMFLPADAKEHEGLNCKSSFMHHYAVVHQQAVLGQGVSIGPFCSVGPYVKLGNACKLYPGSHVSGNAELGGDFILIMGAIAGDDLPGRTVIGCNNTIGHHAVLGIKCQDMKYKGLSASLRLVTTMRSENMHQAIDLRGQVTEQTIPIQLGQVSSISFVILVLFLSSVIKSLRAAYRKMFMSSDGNMRSFEDRLTKLEKDAELNQVLAVCYMVKKSIRDSFAGEQHGIGPGVDLEAT